MKVKIRPVTQRECQITKMHGHDNWEVIHELPNVECLGNEAGVLISKNKHMRWVKSNQIIDRSN